MMPIILTVIGILNFIYYWDEVAVFPHSFTFFNLFLRSVVPCAFAFLMGLIINKLWIWLFSLPIQWGIWLGVAYLSLSQDAELAANADFNKILLFSVSAIAFQCAGVVLALPIRWLARTLQRSIEAYIQNSQDKSSLPAKWIAYLLRKEQKQLLLLVLLNSAYCCIVYPATIFLLFGLKASPIPLILILPLITGFIVRYFKSWAITLPIQFAVYSVVLLLLSRLNWSSLGASLLYSGMMLVSQAIGVVFSLMVRKSKSW